MFGSAPIYDVLTSYTRSSYTPSYKMEISSDTPRTRWKYPEQVKIAENLVGYSMQEEWDVYPQS